MKKIQFGLLAFWAVVLSTGCSTMHFTKGATRTTATHDQWHHIGILRLVEFSDPVDLSVRCEGKGWKTASNEKTFLNGLVGLVTGIIYDPMTVEYSCN